MGWDDTVWREDPSLWPLRAVNHPCHFADGTSISHIWVSLDSDHHQLKHV